MEHEFTRRIFEPRTMVNLHSFECQFTIVHWMGGGRGEVIGISKERQIALSRDGRKVVKKKYRFLDQNKHSSRKESDI
jgi:hypothetical protein